MILFTLHTKKADNYFWVRKKSVKKEDILKMLKDLKSKYKYKKLVILWDGLATHKALVVKDFIEQNKKWLTVHRFPAYAPELNPQEYQWSSLKRKHLGNYCPKTMEHLERKTRNGLQKMKKNKSLLKGFLRKSGLWSIKELGEGQ